MDDEDDDEMGTPPLEDPMPRERSLPPHLQNATSYMRNASPPIQVVQNGVPYQRQHTPQAQMISRPGSRNSVPNARSMSGPGKNRSPSQTFLIDPLLSRRKTRLMFSRPFLKPQICLDA